MQTLRLKQSTLEKDHYKVELRLEIPNQRTEEPEAKFAFHLSDKDREDLRWYLEDYLLFPLEPGEKVRAEHVEKRIIEIGNELFKAVFQSDDTRDLWAKLRDKLNDTRVEIVTEVQEATAIPWELLRDPRTDKALSLTAQSFVRTEGRVAQIQNVEITTSGAIRILLVICRPGRGNDVAFRSVASRLVKALGGSNQTFQLDVLRPATMENLAKVLDRANKEGKPYHVVHFDGHGVYMEVPKDSSGGNFPVFNNMVRFGERSGKHGFLAFERPDSASNMELVGGSDIGKLLVDTNTPVLVLNACQSAYAEEQDGPQSDDFQANVRAFGSLAQEVINAGVSGVVAMRYSVYVITAARFMYDLYAGLVEGQTLGEAVTWGRKQLAIDPLRSIAYKPVPLQDWQVPIIYEARPISLFPKTAGQITLKIDLKAGDATPTRGAISESLPKEPDAGFFGRDETLLALDRGFDTQHVVLLHAYAGSGKTTTAAEFARWYSLTGGVNGPVLFTSFETYKPLARVLDDFGQMFAGMLEQQLQIQWYALSDDQRRDLALQLMVQIPVLWIWDNVEPVAGFPAGTDSSWNAAEQKELVDFLRDARNTKAKFLLTSRRDERVWLGDLPMRVPVRPMPMQERTQLAQALAKKYNPTAMDNVENWKPLLEFTQGNPLTITVLVGQALREGLRTKAQIEDFVQKLRSGEADFSDEESEGRSQSLGASLAYGFQSSFSEEERKILALLHFFQGFVDVDALKWMGNPKAEWSWPEVRGLTREDGIKLLDRAAEIGLLMFAGQQGSGLYYIHPALPWYFKSLFDQYYPSESPASPTSTQNLELSTQHSSALAATQAFVEAIGSLGNYYAREYESGNRDVIGILGAEEANLLHGRLLARMHGWWNSVISTMQGLNKLYDHTGRRAEWRRLVEEIMSDFVDPLTDGPLAGREEEWGLVAEYRVKLAIENRQWSEAERLQGVAVERNRHKAASALVKLPETLNSVERNAVRSLAVSLGILGNIQMEQGKPDCVKSSEEAIKLYKYIGDRAAEAVRTFNLGHAYLRISSIRDLAQAGYWYQRSLELFEQHDVRGRSSALDSLGRIAYERFLEAQSNQKPKVEQEDYLNNSIYYYKQALDLTPPNAINDLAVTHNQLGLVYNYAGDLEKALHHYRESIRYKEAAGNIFAASTTRRNVASTLQRAGRLREAREYALAALQNLQAFGERAGEEGDRAKQTLADIEREMKLQAGDSSDLDAQIQVLDAAGQVRNVAAICYDGAVDLAKAGHFAKALPYAQEALKRYESLGEAGKSDADDARGLIAAIEDAMKKQGGEK